MGTVVRAENGQIVADMFEDGQSRVLLHGGRGGWGNAHFATPTRQAPNFAKPGMVTQPFKFTLELKTIADVGLVGFPNVGKSTILSVVTRAQPKIANYHFTTLTPNLGIVRRQGQDFVMADIPGLVEGASDGAGLGHDFLRHVERTRLLLHVLDVSGIEGRDPVADFDQINLELKRYGDLKTARRSWRPTRWTCRTARNTWQCSKKNIPTCRCLPCPPPPARALTSCWTPWRTSSPRCRR